jgi:hypothetical protein
VISTYLELLLTSNLLITETVKDRLKEDLQVRYTDRTPRMTTLHHAINSSALAAALMRYCDGVSSIRACTCILQVLLAAFSAYEEYISEEQLDTEVLPLKSTIELLVMDPRRMASFVRETLYKIFGK